MNYRKVKFSVKKQRLSWTFIINKKDFRVCGTSYRTCYDAVNTAHKWIDWYLERNESVSQNDSITQN